MIDANAIAEELFTAARERRPVELLTDRFPFLDWDDARRIARATDALRVAAGDQLIGYKLGWTSAAMREALGVDRPNWGTLWRSQVRTAELGLEAFIHPKVEPELVFRSDGAEGEWALGLEIVDPRFPSFDFDALDNTADNSSSAAIVFGSFRRIDSPEQVQVAFSNGSEIRTGLGSNAMESPRRAVQWFVEQFGREGGTLEPGQVVFTGGLTSPFDVSAGVTYSLGANGFDTVQLQA